MKTALRFAGWAVILTLVFGLRGSTVDPGGTWKGAFDFNGNSIPLTFNLKAQGSSLTGTVVGLPTQVAEIHEGKIDGDTITFWLNTDYNSQTYKLVYRGKVSAEQIDFTFGTDDGSWTAVLIAKKGS